jgi:hypothetical protein
MFPAQKHLDCQTCRISHACHASKRHANRSGFVWSIISIRAPSFVEASRRRIKRIS